MTQIYQFNFNFHLTDFKFKIKSGKEKISYMFLPKNEKVKHELSNKLVVWVMGATGTGKTTFATTWPNPIFINTDGNYTQFDTPTIFLQDFMINPQTNDYMYGFEYLEMLIDEFIAQKGQENSYETIVIDLLEDIIRLCDFMVAKQNNVNSSLDIPWGKGSREVSDRLRKLITKLNGLDANVLYISHLVQQNSKDKNGNDIVKFIPKEIKPEWMAMISGRTQLTAVFEMIEIQAQDEQGRLLLDTQGKPKMDTYRILNWEKSERIPAVVNRFNTIEQYCLADYDSMMKTIKGDK